MQFCSIRNHLFRPSSQQKRSSSAGRQNNSYSGVFTSMHHKRAPPVFGNGKLLSSFHPWGCENLSTLTLFTFASEAQPQKCRVNEVAQAFFIAVKQQLADITMLAFPILNAPTQLLTDTSDTAVGAVTQQMVAGVTQPVAFFFKSLTSAKKNGLPSTGSCWPSFLP